MDQRERSFAEAETILEERRRELDAREHELEERRVHDGTAFHLLLEELDSAERERTELRDRLERREQELNAYVAQLQGGFNRG